MTYPEDQYSEGEVRKVNSEEELKRRLKNRGKKRRLTPDEERARADRVMRKKCADEKLRRKQEPFAPWKPTKQNTLGGTVDEKGSN